MNNPSTPHETIFSKIIRKEIPATIVFENDRILAFRDVNPVAPTHILVIPKKPIISIADAEPEDKALLGELLLAAGEIARKEGLPKNGYRIVTNIGDAGGQTVPHLHFHLIGGRNFQWPPG
jgi:histidine triad (HIT) family protein